MDIRTGSERAKKSSIRPITEEPAFQRLVEILNSQDSARTDRLMLELQREIDNEARG
jgi:spore coat polysaccharide biosynthesis protein SpsF (cytidylyltransferase family)